MSGIALTTEFEPLPMVEVDRGQIQSVVTNLLINAKEAVGKLGEIKLETTHKDGRVMLSVTDNGGGMSASFIRDSLYRPFYTTKKRGLGIGMFQSKIIVEAHHGKVRFRNLGLFHHLAHAAAGAGFSSSSAQPGAVVAARRGR